MFQFLTHVELSRSIVTILEMPQYVAYQKNFACAFIKLSKKSHSFNILCTMDMLSCPTSEQYHLRHNEFGINISGLLLERCGLYFGMKTKYYIQLSFE